MSSVDDVFESWEEMEESGVLDKKLQVMNLNPVNGLEDRSSHNSSDSKIIISGNDSGRVQSQFPSKTIVKILKRPERNPQDDVLPINGDKPKQPIKSLKQREQEYAEARKRILGEEKSPEENASADINRIQAKALVQNNYSNPNVMRTPIGPDGTKGFHVRR
ncbi:hypothetical protein TKK_0012042 [Trichogramma kaykai]